MSDCILMFFVIIPSALLYAHFSFLLISLYRFCDVIITAKMMQLEEFEQKLQAHQEAVVASGLTETVETAEPAEGDLATKPKKGKKKGKKSSHEMNPDVSASQHPDMLTPLGLETLMEQIDNTNTDISLWVLRLEKLIDSRALLVNSVTLRRNPHDVSEWLNRVKLFTARSDTLSVIKTFVQAVGTVDPFKAEGKVHSLWAHFASYYERHGQVGDARQVYEKALGVEFKSPESLAHIYCRYAEMELVSTHIRAGGKERARAAIEILTRGTTPPKNYLSRNFIKDAIATSGAANPGNPANASGSGTLTAAKDLVYRSPLLWSFLADLHESYGTVESTKAVYDRLISLKVVTPTLLLNFAAFLETNALFEEAFRAYEMGVTVFSYPHSAPIWITYLKKFVERHGGKRLDRARDIFEQAIKAAPVTHCRVLYVMYANFEEAYGLPRALLRVLQRACLAVPLSERMDMFFLYAAKAAEFFGAVRARDAFDLAMKSLPEQQLPIVALQYAALERKLGDLDRARAIYLYASQYADPMTNSKYWSVYKVFELAHGNDNTYRDMLKARRAVKLHFAQSSLHANALAEKALEKQKMEAKLEHTLKTTVINQEVAVTGTPGAVKRHASEMEATPEKSQQTSDLEIQKTTELSVALQAVPANPDEVEIDFDE